MFAAIQGTKGNLLDKERIQTCVASLKKFGFDFNKKVGDQHPVE